MSREDPSAHAGQVGISSGGAGGEWHLIFQVHSHKGVCSLLTHSPWRPPSPGLPWAAGEPQSGARSSGTDGVGGTARSVTVNTAICGGKRRERGWVPGSHQGRAGRRAPGLGAGGPGASEAQLGPELHQKPLWFSNCTIYHIHHRKVITHHDHCHSG